MPRRTNTNHGRGKIGKKEVHTTLSDRIQKNGELKPVHYQPISDYDFQFFRRKNKQPRQRTRNKT